MAVYGGTFDPFHKGHENVCRSILSHDEISELRIVPCAIPALKAEANASKSQRLEMLNLWKTKQCQAEQQRLIIDPIEVNRQGPSYTIDTLEWLKTHFGCAIVFVLGADAWNSLSKWYRYSELSALVSFWVFQRAGDQPAGLNNQLEKADSIDSVLDGSTSRYWLDDTVQMDISSSKIREGASLNESLLPVSIANYIDQQGLYIS
jgi:nicotinate-nucleotide adenylyltransferase